jgi:glycosyltransferase involved in cell wall biosynthesis
LSKTYSKILNEIITDFKPDIIIFHYPNPFVASFLLKILKHHGEIKFVVYWHLDIIRQKLLKVFFHRQNQKLLKRADRVIATSPNYIEGSKWLQTVADKCTVIPNCINLERMNVDFKTEQRAAQIKADYAGKAICIAVGRHTKYKGLKYLIEASKYLDDNFIVLIGGEGELTESLKAEAKDDKKVVFLGKLHNEDLVSYYLASDIFAFPSITKNEAFGIALAEAMYFGKPAVTFTIPGSGVNYVNLNGVTGIECPNSDSKAFADAIKKLANDEALRKQYGEAGRQRVQELFTYSKFKENIEKLLLSLE